jgi:hypothetical protein
MSKGEEKNKGGRPKVQLSELWEGWHVEILDLYKEGASDVEIRALICDKTGGQVRCSNDLWGRWMKEEIEFSETVKMGKLLSEAWWQKKGRTNIEESKFNSTLWYMNMKNRFGWKDKQELEHTGDLKIEVVRFTGEEDK